MRQAIVTLAAIAAATAAQAKPLTVPFDFSRGALGLDVTVKGQPLHMILDTGVDPSVIDTKRAETLGLKVDRAAGGEASGAGDAKSVPVYPARLDGLAIQGRAFGAFDTLVTDMGGLSESYGRPLDGVLGYSFLRTRIVLIDYPARRIEILDKAAGAAPATRACRRRWATPIVFHGDDNTPILTFQLGEAAVPGTLDTGSNGGVALFQGALDKSGVRGALIAKGEISATGPRGADKAKVYAFQAPIGFGPFRSPPGQEVTVRAAKGSADTRLANVGNQLFAGLKLKMLLDYPGRRITFFGDCR